MKIPYPRHGTAGERPRAFYCYFASLQPIRNYHLIWRFFHNLVVLCRIFCDVVRIDQLHRRYASTKINK
jgi:hypothetical protein